MKRTVVMAFEDATRPEGGHASLLLSGVRDNPDNLRFDLRLIDAADDAAPAAGLIGKSLEPVATRLTGEGLELVVGPDVTGAADLMAGTAVELAVPMLGVRAEFLWPDITPMARPKRRLKVGRAASRNEPLRPEPRGSDPLARVDTSEARTEPEPVAAPSADVVSLPVRQRPPLEAPPPAAATPVPAPPEAPPRPLVAAAPAAVPEQGRTEPATRIGAAAQAPMAPAGPANANGPAIAPRPPVGGSWLGFAMLVAAGILLVQAVAYAAFVHWAPTSGADRPVLAGGTGKLGMSAERDVFELLAAPGQSPAGVSAGGVSAARALELAAERLQGGTAVRDTAEGAFWLRHYLTDTLGKQTAVRALTQLGSAHAEPSGGEPDYAKAHRLWQIAAAWGDPVAMCFLASLHANGLGVAKDSAAAERWRVQAAPLGGCPDAGGR